MQTLYEQYRPNTWAEVAGQDKAVKTLLALKARSGFAGSAFWIAGLSGTGKTTIARLIAEEVADPWFVTEINASELTIGTLRDLEYDSHFGATGKGGRAYIVNEAHRLRRDIIEPLLKTIEPVKANAVWIFTTTIEGQEFFEGQLDAGPFASRCKIIEMSRRGIAEPMAQRLKQGAMAEGLDGQPVEKYVKLLYDCKLNMRAAWQKIEMGYMVQ